MNYKCGPVSKVLKEHHCLKYYILNAVLKILKIFDSFDNKFVVLATDWHCIFRDHIYHRVIQFQQPAYKLYLKKRADTYALYMITKN